MTKITVNIKSAGGDVYKVEVDDDNTIREFKEVLAKESHIPADMQKLIFAGAMLRDDRTVQSYAIKDGFTVHLVKAAPKQQTTTPSTTSQSTSTTTPSTPSAGNPTATPGSNTTSRTNTTSTNPGAAGMPYGSAPGGFPGLNPFAAFGGAGGMGGFGGMPGGLAGFGGAGGLGGFGGAGGMGGFGGAGGMGGFGGMPASRPGPPGGMAGFGGMPEGMGGFGGMPGFGLGGIDPSQLQAMQQQLLNNPAIMNEMTNMLSQNPELVRSILMSNPQMRQIIDNNPEIGHIFNDPEILRQTLEIYRNPELYREMMRNTDRAMSNIESNPEGFNLLRRMYTNVQEPLLNATTASTTTSNLGTTPQAANAPPDVPLPNPWTSNRAAATPATTATTAATATPATPVTPVTPAAAPNPFSLGNFDVPPPNPFVLGTQPTPTDPNANPFQASVMNPYMQPQLFNPQMLSAIMQNPAVSGMIQQFVSNPQMLQQLINSDPMVQQMVNANPFMRSVLQNPEMFQQLVNSPIFQSLLHGGFGFPTPMTSQPFAPPATHPQTAQPAAQPPNQEPPEVRFREQLEQLSTMGFTNTQQNIALLIASNGDINITVDRLLQKGN